LTALITLYIQFYKRRRLANEGLVNLTGIFLKLMVMNRVTSNQ